MVMNLIRKFFGPNNDKVVKGLLPTVETVASFEPAFEKLSD